MAYELKACSCHPLRDFMCFIEGETHNFIVKFGEIFPWRETRLNAHGMKSDEKLFFCQILLCVLRKNGTCCDEQVLIFFISEGF